jgi:hypothetical protein
MWQRTRDFAGTISAIIAIAAVAVAIINWAAGNADRIVPSVLAGISLAFWSFQLLGHVLELLARSRGTETKPDREDLGWLFVLAALVAIMVSADFWTTAVHGSYEEGNQKWLVVLFGVGTLYQISMIVIRNVRDWRQGRAREDWAPRGRKVCPQCAEFPRERARVCPFCGHPFVAH